MNKQESLIGTESNKFPLIGLFNNPEELFECSDNLLFEVVCDCMISKITKKPLLNIDGTFIEIGSPILLLGLEDSDDAMVLKYSDDLVNNIYEILLNRLIETEDYEYCNTLKGLYEIYNS